MNDKSLVISKYKRDKFRYATARATLEELQSFILGTILCKEEGARKYRWIEIEIPDSFPQTKFLYKRGDDLCNFLYDIITPAAVYLDKNRRFIYKAKGKQF